MHFEQTIDYFTFYLTDAPLEDENIDPFHIHIQVKPYSESEIEEHTTLHPDVDLPPYKSGYAVCNNVVCSDCPLQPTCKDGQHVTRAAIEYAKDEFPEALI